MDHYFERPDRAKAIRDRNPDNFNPNLGNIRYRVDHNIFIYSVARRDFTVSQTLFPKLVLVGCQPGQRWCLASQCVDPILQASPDLERGGARTDMHDGWQAAIGLLNPENSTPDPWANAEGSGMSVGVNLISQGLWPSFGDQPEEADIKRAEGLRDRRYERMTKMAFAASRQSSRALATFLHEHEDVHDAMDALGLSADWHKTHKVLQMCPNCGDDIQSGIAFHRSSSNVLCVLDADRAFKAGAIDEKKFNQLTRVVA